MIAQSYKPDHVIDLLESELVESDRLQQMVNDSIVVRRKEEARMLRSYEMNLDDLDMLPTSQLIDDSILNRSVHETLTTRSYKVVIYDAQTSELIFD